MIDQLLIAKALSDPIRYQILKMLVRHETGCCVVPGENGRRGGLCNCELMAELHLIQSRVSYHMKELTACGLVTEQPRGKWKYYYLNPETLKLFVQQLNEDFALD